MNFELSVLDFIQENLRSGLLDRGMLFLTAIADSGLIWIVCAAVLLAIPRTRRAGAAVTAALLLEVFCCNAVLKPLVARIRPFDVNTSVQLLIRRPTDFSFPSGHTGASFAAASALYFGKRRIWVPAVVLACLIGFSRLYLYVHYPTDVLAGAALGILTGWLGCKAVDFLWKKPGRR